MLFGARYSRSLGALVVAIAFALAGCGDDDSSSNDPYAKLTLSDEQKVQLVIADFYGANRRQICDSLSSGALEEAGGRNACMSKAKPVATDYNVQSVRFDTAGEAITVVRVAGKPVQFTLVDESGDYKVSEPLPPGL